MNARLLTAVLLFAACATPTAVKVEPAKPVAAPAPTPPAEVRLPGEEVLDTQPTIPALSTFEAPVPVETVLKNGLRVLVVERKGAPIQSLALVIKRGSTSDPAGKSGLAALTGAMLEAGSAKKSSSEIAALANALGAELRVMPTTEGFTLTLTALPTRVEPIAALLADVALKPNFDAKEWKKVHEQRVAQLKEQLAEPRVAAGNAFASALYGDGPLGHTVFGTPTTVAALTLDDVKKFWAEAGPGEAALIAVGAVPNQQVVDLATKLFGGWKASTAKAKPAEALKPVDRPRLVLVEFPGRPQTVLQVGQPAVPMSSPDLIALRVMNSILGGSFTSRLNANLREKNGYTYGAGSGFSFGRTNGPFVASANVKTQVTGPALKELLFEVGRIVDEPLTDAEVAKGKSLLAYGLVEQLQRADSTSGLVSQLFVAGMPLDTLKQFVPKLQSLTAAEVQAAAKRTLDPKAMTITVVGDPAVIGQFEAAGLGLPAPQKRTALGTP
jgi:zinc protease